MERCKVMKPGGYQEDNDLTNYYKPSDAYIGAQMVFKGSTFKLYNADEHTLQFMEENTKDFPVADYDGILQKLKPLIKARVEELEKMANNFEKECLSFEEFKCFIKKLLSWKSGSPICIVLHEVVTLARHHATKYVNLFLQIYFIFIISDKIIPENHYLEWNKERSCI